LEIMKTLVRKAARGAAIAGVAALLSGCAGETGAGLDPATPAAPETPPPPEELKTGQRGEFTDFETDGLGNPAPNTTFTVTVERVRYATTEETGLTGEPTRGQYALLTLTVRNTGDKEGSFLPEGRLTWESDTTTPDDALPPEAADGSGLGVAYAPRQSVTGTLVLDIGAKGGRISYADHEANGASFHVELPAS
jgi:hypothetical protein